MTDSLWSQAEYLASRPYDVKVDEDQYPDGSLVFMAYNPELLGCKAEGQSQPEAIANLAEARIDYIYALLMSNLPVPEPNPYTNISWTGQSSKPAYELADNGVITYDFQSSQTAQIDSVSETASSSDHHKESSSTQLRGDLVKHG